MRNRIGLLLSTNTMPPKNFDICVLNHTWNAKAFKGLALVGGLVSMAEAPIFSP